MATKQDLKDEILVKATDAGLELDLDALDKMNHAELTVKLKEVDDAIEELERAKVEIEEDSEFKVSKGVAITSLRGMEQEGATVTAACFTGGIDAVRDLLAKGFIA